MVSMVYGFWMALVISKNQTLSIKIDVMHTLILMLRNIVTNMARSRQEQSVLA